ncbi:MAG: DEAD/DEAH box helicase [Actinomycetota bacterium]
MAFRTQQLDRLQMSWNGIGPVLWALDGGDVAGQLALRSLVTMAFGYDGLALLGSAVTPLYLPNGGGADGRRGGSSGGGPRATYAPSLQPFEHTAVSFLNERHAVAETSASVRWMFAAADLGLLLARSGLIAPMVTQRLDPDATGRSGDPALGWEAGWRLRHTDGVDRAITSLAAQAPPAVWAPFPGQAPSGAARDVVAYVADSAARWALTAGGWHPDLGRSSRADLVVARRVTGALREERAVSVSNREQELAAGAIGLALDEHRVSVDAGLGFRSRARLRLPESEPDGRDGDDPDDDPEGGSRPWRVSFEVVLVDDPSVTIPWSALLANTVQPTTTAAGVELSEAALSVMSREVETLAVTLSARIPEFADLDPVTGVVLLDLDQVTRLLADGVERCAGLGCALLVPRELAPRRVHLAGSARAQQQGGLSADLGQTMVDVDWSVALGDRRLTDAELTALAASKSELVQLRGAWIRVDAGHVARALEELDRRRSDSAMTPAQLLRLAASADAAGDGDGAAIELVADDDGRTTADGWLADLMVGLPDDRLTEAVEPDGFVGQLRPYQRRAVGWLGFLARLGLGGCLADDMGLGKTPTTLAHLVANPGDRPNLVICPLSVVHNWEAEAAAFAPKFRVLIAHGASRKRGEAFVEQLADVDLVISTYGTVSRDVEAMSADRWNIVVCDEAQAIKNHRTKAARAIRALEARQLVALTGTPVENRLTELWSILDAVNPGSLGGVGWFRDTFATPIETKGDEDALAGMKRLTGPFVLRRTKADKSLVPDLPDKVEQVAWAGLTDEQAGLYQAVLDDFLAKMEGEGDDQDGPGASGEGGRGTGRGADRLLGAPDSAMQRRGLVLATLTRLKQICNHPAQFLAAGGEEPGRLAGRSGKLDRFDELVSELLDADERALVFTQYREMGELLVAHLATTHRIRAEFLHGGVSRTGRDEMVRNFQSGEGPPLQVVSLKAGGTGLNLTAASRVIHYDRWWNPAVEDQATDRAWRIGQRATVFVHKLVCRGTMEERIDALLVDKKALAESAVSTGEAWLTEMTTDELRGLFRLDRITPDRGDPA